MGVLTISCLAPMEVKRCRVQIRIILNRKGEVFRGEPGSEQAIYDPFCGSGSTLLAAAQFEASWLRLQEVDPEHVAVGLERDWLCAD